jgi:hypothetical protein
MDRTKRAALWRNIAPSNILTNGLTTDKERDYFNESADAVLPVNSPGS